jgi:hypothetical protein
MPAKFPHLVRLESTLANRFGKTPVAGVPREWSEFPLSWVCYGLRDVAVRKPSPIWQADAAAAIVDLFQCYYRPVIDEVSEKIGIRPGDKNVISVFVQPDSLKLSTVLVVQPGTGNLVYLNQVKARDLWFDLPADIEADLDEQFKAICKRVR